MAGNVLVIAPHPDDESIGCGGTICLHRQRGERVGVVFLTSGERGLEGVPAERACAIREREAEAALAVLGVQDADFLRLADLGLAGMIAPGARRLHDFMASKPPDLVYLPHPDEAHPDHHAALALVRAALVQAGGGAPLPELRGYEVWTPMAAYGWPEDISAVMARKLQAIRCYRSQLVTFRYDRAVRGLNQYRGCLAARCRYAEVFCSLAPAVPTDPLAGPRLTSSPPPP
jgi:LmbE family N-acetylglucosaminyl deacetylase